MNLNSFEKSLGSSILNREIRIVNRHYYLPVTLGSLVNPPVIILLSMQKPIKAYVIAFGKLPT